MRRLINLEHGSAIPFTDQQLDELKQKYLKGFSAARLSKIYGISKSSVLRRLRVLGVEIRQVGSKNVSAKLMADNQ